MQNITIAQTGAVTSTPFVEGMTLSTALETAGVEVGEGRQILLNGAATTNYATTLRANDMILIVGAIRGA